MKKNCLVIALILALSTAAMEAQDLSKLDVRGRSQLTLPKLSTQGLDNKTAPSTLPKARRIAELSPADYVSAFITLNDGFSAADLEKEGVAVINSRGRISIASMPKSDVLRVSGLDCVKSIQLERPASVKMDLARPASGVDKVQSGLDLPKAYTGEGVLAGIIDGGFDPNHINFRGDDGYSRLRYLVVNEVDNNSKVTSTWFTDDPAAAEWSSGYGGTLADFTTDAVEDTHGTHTLGIMAGNYRGPITAASADNTFSSTVSDLEENPWYGIASGATLMACAGTASDALIAQGIACLESYATAMNLPSVINLSLGTNLGPHDGSSPISLYMDELAETEGYIPITFCLAAGNEGAYPIAINRTLTEEDNTIKTGLYPYLTADQAYFSSGYLYYRNVEIEIYSADETPIDVSAVVFNAKRPTASSYTASMPLAGDEPEGYKLYVSDSEVQSSVGGTILENFGKYYTGMVYMANGYEVNELTGQKRFVVYIYINAYKRINDAGTGYVDPDDNYAMGLVVNSASGNKIDMYADGLMCSFDDYGRTGWISGSTNGSISDMATGRKIVAVGAYNTRNIYGGLDGSAPFNDAATFPLGEVSTFSSYGTLSDGRNLPHVCAPGTYIISSTSQYYVEEPTNEVAEGDIQGILVEGTSGNVSRRNYWQAMAGTSMACPYVAGAIAQWLEADPTLTPTRIKEIIAETAVKDDDVAKGDPVQWGAGKFDAYAGLKEVLRGTGGISRTTIDRTVRPVITADGYHSFRVFLAGADRMDVTLYDMLGRIAGHYRCEGDEIAVDASSLAAGVYVLRIDGCAEGQRIIVK